MQNEYPLETRVRDLIRALQPYPKGRRSKYVYDDVRRAKECRGEEIGDNFEASTRDAFNQYNRDGSAWRKKGEKLKDALFFCPEGLRIGLWAVDLETAEKWMAESPFKGRIELNDGDETADF